MPTEEEDSRPESDHEKVHHPAAVTSVVDVATTNECTRYFTLYLLFGSTWLRGQAANLE